MIICQRVSRAVLTLSIFSVTLCRVKLLFCLLSILVAGRSPAADTNLLSSGKWAVDGTPDFSTNLPAIRVVAGKTPLRVSELKFFYSFDGTNLVQVFSLTGSGTFQPALPAPGEAGGSFQFGSYRDCAQGLVGALAVTDIVLPSKAKHNGVLQLTGALANGDSLRGDKLVLTFHPPLTNSVRVDVQCHLVATRDFCVDQSMALEQDKFRVATISAGSASSPTDFDNDLARYVWLAEKHCFGWYGCYTRYKSECFTVTNSPAGYLISAPHVLGKPWLLLAHTSATPRVTPSLQVTFRTPGGIHPQGFLVAPLTELWGNWAGIKKSYKAKRTVVRLNCTLEAFPPRPISCDLLHN